MKRTVVSLVAVALALAVCSVSLAGPGGKDPKQGGKKTVMGTICALDAKQKTVTVKPEGGKPTQVQTQAAPEQKGKAPAGPTVFKVDAKTVITQQGAAQGQAPLGFEALKQGQMVRVVFGDAGPGKGKGGKAKGEQVKPAAPAAQADQKQTQKPEQKQDQKPTQKPEQKPTQSQDQKPVPKPVVALSIEILAQPGVQQK